MKKLSLLMMLVALALWAGASAVGATLYTHTFDNLTDVSSSGPGFASVPAPGGKSGNALHISGGSGGVVIVTPTGAVGLAGPATIIFRFYVVNPDNDFAGAYNYLPNEGIIFQGNGAVADSYLHHLTTYQTGTWYTCAIYHPPGQNYLSFYLKQGAGAVLSEADFIGASAYPPAALDLQCTEFFNYAGNGDWYVDDYTVNSDKDFMIAHPVTVQGAIDCGDYLGDLQDVGVRIRFLQEGVEVQTARVFLGTDGSFVLPNMIDAGTYDVAIKSASWLQKILPNVSITGETVNLNTIELIKGDVDGDNEVTSADLSVVLKNMDAIGNQ